MLSSGAIYDPLICARARHVHDYDYSRDFRYTTRCKYIDLMSFLSSSRAGLTIRRRERHSMAAAYFDFRELAATAATSRRH